MVGVKPPTHLDSLPWVLGQGSACNSAHISVIGKPKPVSEFFNMVLLLDALVNQEVPTSHYNILMEFTVD